MSTFYIKNTIQSINLSLETGTNCESVEKAKKPSQRRVYRAKYLKPFKTEESLLSNLICEKIALL